MSTQTVQSLHQAALAHLKAGRRAEAASIFESLVHRFPNYAPAPFSLGVMANEAGNHEVALAMLNKAIAIDPSFAEPHFVRGLIFYRQRKYPEAIAAYRRLLALRPNDGKGLNNLGRAQLDLGEIAEATQTLRQAVSADPKNAGAQSNLGDAFRKAGDNETAITQYQKAILVDPNCAEAHGNLGIALVNSHQVALGLTSMQRALAINPKMYNPRFNLARKLHDLGKLDEAVRQCQLAIEIRPDSGEAHNAIGNMLGLMGEMTQCLAAQTKAVELEPDHIANHSNLLLTLQYRDDISQAERFAAHRQWNARHIVPFTPLPAVDRIRNGRLRIGYVSPDFHSHSVAYFFEPVLEAHDKSTVQIFCYSNTKEPDEVTVRLQSKAEHWREIYRKPAGEAAALIRDDQIDVLVDLAGHTAYGCLPIFGYRPAPVQITWLGYPDTTGMTAMDYRLTDSIADPPGDSDLMHTEKLIRLNGGCWAYHGPDSAPALVAPPCVRNQYVTFGSFNNLPKVSPEVLEIWAGILHKTPHSRLLIKAAGLRGQIGRNYVSAHLQRFGLDPSRYELLDWANTTESHLRLYDRLDIALDPFPYNGTTTTCEALWMGVPVITFPGDRHVSRVGASLLTHAGCSEWIAKDVQDYQAKAVELANDPQRLVNIRQGLRRRLQGSELGDANRLARELERVYAQTSAELRPSGDR